MTKLDWEWSEQGTHREDVLMTEGSYSAVVDSSLLEGSVPPGVQIEFELTTREEAIYVAERLYETIDQWVNEFRAEAIESAKARMAEGGHHS